MTSATRSATCCGLYEIGSFSAVKWGEDGRSVIERNVEELTRDINVSLSGRENFLNFSTINDEQFKYKNLVKALESCGFEEKVQWRNPNSSHEVKFYLRLPDNKRTKVA